MSWQKKIERIRSLSAENEEIGIVFECSETGVPESALGKLLASFPFLPDEYIDFLAITNGAQLDHCVLFGTDTSSFPVLDDLHRRWKELFPPNNYFCFGEDSGGGVFYLQTDGSVWLAEPQAPHSKRVISSGFGYFLDEILMGSKYATILFPFGTFQGDELLEFLKREGWA